MRRLVKSCTSLALISFADSSRARAMSAAASPAGGGTSRPLIIFCHGSGDTGRGAEAWVRRLVPASEYARWDWIFPSAEPIPYALNGGRVTSVWYDRAGGFNPELPEQTESVERSTDRLLDVVREESASRGGDPGAIVVGGFSMGGAIALQTAARWHALEPTAGSLGGVFGLSCYLNRDSKVWALLRDIPPANKWPRTFMAHGGSDDFIPPEWGAATHERMVQMGVPAEFTIVPGVHHDMIPGEIAELLQFLRTNLEGKGEGVADQEL